jgi:streptogramin lyase
VTGLKARRAVVAIVFVAIIAVASTVVYEQYYASASVPCQLVKAGTTLKTQLSKTTFGGVTEYALPRPDRWPNAIVNASDGSVWIAEQEIPGVAHFFPTNGTLVEYPWPGYPSAIPPDCSPGINVSGITIWNGRVWSADEFGNAIVGVDLSDGSVVSVNSTERAPYPYWVAVGPDGDLWFTSDNFAGQPSVLGRILPNDTLEVVNLIGLGNDQPLQIDFVNSTLALLSTINQAPNATTEACICTGHIYSFDPATAGSQVTPSLVGGGYTLVLPTSLSFLNGSVWVTQHAASSVVRYDFATRTWTKYPTSIVSWIDITLPYVIQEEGGNVWFNEHYANKIAMINPELGTLTEFSEANPPIADPIDIQNDLSIAPAPNGLWFTSESGNYIGFVNASYNPGFSIFAEGKDAAEVLPGGEASFTLQVSGSWANPMNVNVSDSENIQSIPHSITVTPGVAAIPQGVSPFALGVQVSVGGTTVPGNYTLAVTVTNGDVQQSAYLFLVVT